MNQDPDDLQKWAYLAQVPYVDAEHPRIRRIAHALWTAADARPEWFAKLALCVARDCVRFASDTRRTGGEDIAGYTRAPADSDAVDALNREADDCDAKARLFVALCLAAGLKARMRPLWRDGRLSHVYAEVFINGAFQNAETTLARARLGDLPNRVPKEENTGRWLRS